MSNYYTAADKVSIEKKPVGKLEKGIKRILIVAAVILAVQLIWLFIVSPFIPFSTIDIQGIPELSRNDILSISGINESSSYFSTNTKSVQRILSAHILVESATVMKRFPDKISIFLSPREAAAVTLGYIGNKQVPICIDRQGVFFKIGEDKDVARLPLLSGIENPQLNTRLPVALVPLAENLYQMASDSPEILSAISEIRIENKAWEGFDLVLFPVHSSIRVRVEKNFSQEVLRYMLLMLNVFEGETNKPREIDFRSGIGSYNVKELSL